jgi:hypothetical protein
VENKKKDGDTISETEIPSSTHRLLLPPSHVEAQTSAHEYAVLEKGSSFDGQSLSHANARADQQSAHEYAVLEKGQSHDRQEADNKKTEIAPPAHEYAVLENGRSLSHANAQTDQQSAHEYAVLEKGPSLDGQSTDLYAQANNKKKRSEE